MEAPKTVEIELDEVDMKEKEDKKVNADDLAYAIEDVPPWYLCIFLGFQVRFYFFLKQKMSSLTALFFRYDLAISNHVWCYCGSTSYHLPSFMH